MYIYSVVIGWGLKLASGFSPQTQSSP